MSISLLRPVVLDLEVRASSAGAESIYAFAAAQPGASAGDLNTLEWSEEEGTSLKSALQALDAFTESGAFLVAHNGRHHDLPILRRVAPELRLHGLPLIDTLELSPLCFPRNPYHRLVKDYKLVGASGSQPLRDCALALSLLEDEIQALGALPPELASIYATLLDDATEGDLPLFFSTLGVAPLPLPQLLPALEQWLAFPRQASSREEGAHKGRDHAQCCAVVLREKLPGFVDSVRGRASIAYLLAWLTTVVEGTSVIPGWVRRQHPGMEGVVRALRQTPCEDRACSYCREVHDLEANLNRYFHYTAFRGNRDDAGSSMQRDLVEALSAGRSVLGVLPTGGGKSLCYQLPALMLARQRKTLTVIISPLQSLMKDQVDGLKEDLGIPNVGALYGGLAPPERSAVIEGVALGSIDLLYVSPEQLRNRSFRSMVSQREVGLWIVDEAHCLSKWGHDFRPDYLYIAAFIQGFREEFGGGQPVLGCFTATARQEVIDEIVDYFKEGVGADLQVMVGGGGRPNLRYTVIETQPKGKLGACVDLLRDYLQEGQGGAAVIFASSRKRAERLAEALMAQGWRAGSYHAGLGEARPGIQEAFIKGELKVIVATNAFGMGVDKSDVRLVIHADIPGSLEAYLQEAGRAGRDGDNALCVLLYHEQDIDAQFRLQALNRLSIQDIREILKGLKSLASKLKKEEIIATAGEILREPEVVVDPQLKGRQQDTKVRTALLVLEQGEFVSRGENRYEVFQGKLKAKTMTDVERRLKPLGLPPHHLSHCLALARVLLTSGDDALHSTDHLAEETGIAPEELVRVMKTLREGGISTLSLQLTAFVVIGGPSDSRSRLRRVGQLERGTLEVISTSPDLPGDAGPGGQELELKLSNLTTRLNEHHPALAAQVPEVRRVLFSLARHRVWRLMKRGAGSYGVELFETLPVIKARSSERLALAGVLFDAIHKRAKGEKGRCQVSFTMADLERALEGRLFSEHRPKEGKKRIEECLLFLHDGQVLTLQGGLTVLRPAMSLKVPQGTGRFKNKDFQPLEALYESQVAHIHIMGEYARMGLEDPETGLGFVRDYFELRERDFLERYFPSRIDELKRPLLQSAFDRIVTDLNSPPQQEIVTSKERALLVLAGPGSGKTRVVVHRVAYLLGVERVPPSQVLVLSFNRSVAREIRARLGDLAGQDGRRVSVFTYHGLALRILGLDLREPGVKAKIRGENQRERARLFESLLDEAAELLEAGGEEAEAWHREVMQGWRYIFVDEYQDVNKAQYRLIRALTGSHLEDRDIRLTLMAVGDDDQSIYSFTGANVEYIKRFEADYGARKQVLLQNHRSVPPIVRTSGALIAHNHDRMKSQLPLTSARSAEGASPVRLHYVESGLHGARLVVKLIKEEIKGGRALEELAVLGREHRDLSTLALLLEKSDIPFHQIKSPRVPFHRLRQVRRVMDALESEADALVGRKELLGLIKETYENGRLDPVGEELRALVFDWEAELGGAKATARSFLESIYERSHEPLRTGRNRGRVVLSTLHAAKGLEFEWVALMGAPSRRRIEGAAEVEEERRLLYVGMTRAKDHLHLIDQRDRPSPFFIECLRVAPSECLKEERVEVVLEPGDRDAEGVLIHDLSLSDLWTSFPARGALGYQGVCISKLEAGDPLELRAEKGGVSIRARGIEVGRLSKERARKWSRPTGELTIHVESVEVAEICVMDRQEGDEPAPRWELVIPRVRYRLG